MNYLYIILASLATSLISLIGILFLNISTIKLKKIILFLVSVSTGTLLGDTFIHILPESIETVGNNNIVWFGVLFGIILFFSLEKIIQWKHNHQSDFSSLGVMNLVGDGVHNLIDGMIISGSFLIDVNLGIITTIAVISHEIPQEIGDFGVLIHSGIKPKRAIFFNFISGILSIIGAIITILINEHFQNFIDFILPITAGGFIYIASSDLIPELKKEYKLSKTIKQLIGIFIGISSMILLKLIFE